MTYQEFMNRSFFTQTELIAFAYGNLVDDPPPGFDGRLPAPPFLMLDRVLELERNGRRGRIVAEQDVRIDAWFFQCHMPGDPVHPGCLCVDAIWQLLGFYGIWRGALGVGRALGCGEVSFEGQVRPHDRCVRYEISVKRFVELKDSGSYLVIGDGEMFVDGEFIGYVKDAKTGVFQGIVYRDYPWKTTQGTGGTVRRKV